MKVLFRVDASPQVGLGHLVRSLAVAEVLRKKYQAAVTFASLPTREIEQYVLPRNFALVKKPTDISEEVFLTKHLPLHQYNVLYIDHLYPYSEPIIKAIRKFLPVILVQNFCEGRFACHAFILPSGHHPDEIMHDPRWLSHAVHFYHGLDYVILNTQIKALKPQKKHPEGKNMIITTGGSDPQGVLIKLINYLQEIDLQTTNVKVLIGSSFLHLEKLKELQAQVPGNFIFLDYHVSHLLDADLAITTFGVSTYELIYLGTPVITVGHATPNAIGSKILADRYHATIDLGHINALEKNSFLHALDQVIHHPDHLNFLQQNAKQLIDGQGDERVAGIISNI